MVTDSNALFIYLENSGLLHSKHFSVISVQFSFGRPMNRDLSRDACRSLVVSVSCLRNLCCALDLTFCRTAAFRESSSGAEFPPVAYYLSDFGLMLGLVTPFQFYELQHLFCGAVNSLLIKPCCT